MNSPDETRHCETCGGPIPATAPSGVCKTCLASSLETDLGLGPAVPRDPVRRSDLQVPGYELVGELGEGASGEVWLARELEPPRREVALKVLKPELVAGAAGVRFEAEMSALALMDHPGVARVFGSGKAIDGRPYFAMELVEGAPITEYCDQEQLTVRERLVLFEKLCGAIAHAHRRGIIHRDLKPSNVLVTVNGGSGGADGKPKVIDFGIAKATETLLTEQTLLTRANVFLGTPAYMSPEQATMQSEAIDTRTDIYALGVMLYELLTGARPFAATESTDLPYDEILRQIRTQDPPKPSIALRQESGTKKNAISTDLDWIVMKALEKDPERRYESADAFARDIANFLGGDAIAARPPTVGYRLRKYVRKHRGPVAAGAAVGLALIAGTVVSLTMYVRAEENAERAQKQATIAGLNARTAEANERRRREVSSRSDFTQATPLMADRRPSRAVALLARAVRTDPTNRAAATRLLYTLASEDWAVPVASLPLNGNLAFNGDGSRIAVARNAVPGAHRWNPYLKIFSAQSGEELHRCDLDDDVNCFALAPDGDLLAVGTADGTIALVSMASGELVQRIRGGLAHGIRELAFASQGGLLAASYWGPSTAHVWNLPEGKLAGTFQLPEANSSPGMIALSREGDLLAFACGSALRVFDLESGKPASRVFRHAGAISGVGFTLRGALVSWSTDSTARVWDYRSNTAEAAKTLTHEQAVATGAVSPDGSRLMTGTGDGQSGEGTTRIWDLETGTVIGKVLRHPGRVHSVSFSADGTTAVSGSEILNLGDGAVNVIDAWSGELLAAPIYHPRGALDVALSPDANVLAISSRHLETSLWELAPSAMRPTRLAHEALVWRAVFDESPDRASVVTLSSGGAARRWDAETGEPMSEAATSGPVAVAAHASAGDDTLRNGFQSRRWIGSYRHTSPNFGSLFRELIAPRYSEGEVHVAAASDDGRVLVTGCADGKVRLWSLETGEAQGPPLAHGEGAVTALALDLAGRRLVSGGQDGRLTLWDIDGRVALGAIEAHRAEVSAVAIGPGGMTTIASGSIEGTVRLWWPEREPAVTDLLEHGKLVNHLAFRPDGRVVAVSGKDNAVRLLNADTGKQMGSPMSHIDGTEYGLFLLWSPDGSRLVTTGSSDNTARVWDPLTSSPVAKPMEMPTSAYSAALSPDGTALLLGEGGSWQGRSRVWDLESGEPLTEMGLEPQKTISASFDASGRRYVMGSLGGLAVVRDLPKPEGPLPAALVEYAEAVGGFRYDDRGVLEPVPPEALAVARGKVGEISPEAPGAKWIKWLVTNRDDRSVSPFSRLAMERYVDDLLNDGTTESLREAIRLRPGKADIMAKLGERLARGRGEDDGRRLHGEFLVELAAARAPDDPVVARAQTRILLGRKDRIEEGLLDAVGMVVEAAADPESWLLLGEGMERLHWHAGEAVAYEQARLLAEEAGAVALAARAKAARDRVRPQQEGSAQERFDLVVGTAAPRAEALREIFAALESGDFKEAIVRVRKEREYSHRPAATPEWATLGEIALLAAHLADASGDGGTAQRYREAGCAALSCGALCGTRRQALAELLAHGGQPRHEMESEPWIEAGSDSWAYLAGAAARTPPDGWMDTDFDDREWPRGTAPLGYGGDGEETQLEDGAVDGQRTVAAYFRRAFEVEEDAEVPRLRLRIRRDDGAVVYLNGSELFRSNMPEGEVGPETAAVATVGGDDERRFETAVLLPDALRSGRNLLAVEVHQVNPTSSDLMLDVELGRGIPALGELLARQSTATDIELLGLEDLDGLWLESTRAIEAEQFAQAEEILHEVWKRAPENPAVANYLGFVLVRQGELKEAELIFARGLELARTEGRGQATLERNLEYVRSQLKDGN